MMRLRPGKTGRRLFDINGALNMTKLDTARAEQVHVHNLIERTKAQREAGYKLIVRSDGKLKDLERELARLQRRVTKLTQEGLAAIPNKGVAIIEQELGHVHQPKSEVSDISWSELTGADLREEPIPAFLQRTKKTPDDIAAMAAIEVEQANRRLAKSRGRIEKMKAKQRGDLKRMPLSGKAALAAIRES
jgi:hypothetical protein